MCGGGGSCAFLYIIYRRFGNPWFAVLHLFAYMSRLIRFVNHSLKHFFTHDIEDSCDGSNQFKDGSPISFRLMVTWMLCTRETSWRARRRRLLRHFQYVFSSGKVLSVTVRPKAGRWKKQAYFAKSVSILRPSSLGLDGKHVQCTRPRG